MFTFDELRIGQRFAFLPRYAPDGSGRLVPGGQLLLTKTSAETVRFRIDGAIYDERVSEPRQIVYQIIPVRIK